MTIWESIKEKRKNGIKSNTDSIEKNSKEVAFKMVSCMCDNKEILKLKKNSANEFKLHYTNGMGMGYSISNLQMEFSKFEVEWKADEEKWEEVAYMIETGTSLIESIMSR